jgi:hypothetical protein
VRVGAWVQVRQEAEILRTLDANGALNGMPFLPEMLEFCGRRFQVHKRAHKTCDSINHVARSVRDSVHLQTRCSGEAHGGCQAGCLLFWKEAWLQSVDGPRSASAMEPTLPPREEQPALHCTRATLLRACVAQDSEPASFRCQATQVLEASTELPWWDLRQYVEDVRSGNVTFGELACGASHAMWIALLHLVPWPKGLVLWCYEHFRALWRGAEFPRRVGRIPKGQRTPSGILNLAPGELVRVRPLEEIDRTLDCLGQNRGLYFDSEQVPYANRTFRVLHRVDRIISEETGKMVQIKAPTVILDSVVCQGQYSSCRMFCPRGAYLLWREAWLERSQFESAESI